MLKQILFTAAILISTFTVTFAQTDSPNKCIDSRSDFPGLSDDARIAYKSLLKTDVFETSVSGFKGGTSLQIKNLGVLMQERDSVSILNSILENGTPAGKLYALSGLYYADRSSFEVGRAALRESETMVRTLNGCIMFELPMGKIIEADEANAAIINPGQTMKDFWATNTDGKQLDIAHGGYPTIFREAVGLKN